MTRLALEAVGQGGLGYSFESLNEESSNNFGNAMKGFMSVWSLAYIPLDYTTLTKTLQFEPDLPWLPFSFSANWSHGSTTLGLLASVVG